MKSLAACPPPPSIHEHTCYAFCKIALPLFSKTQIFARSLVIVTCLFPPLFAQAEQNSIQSKLAEHSLLLDGHQVQGKMVAVGDRGHILYSDDDGQQWHQANVPTRVLLTGVYMHDTKLGWAVGHDATILRTEDGGQNWQQVYKDVEQEAPLLDVWFRDANSGYAVGAYGLFLETNDSGQTWEQRWVNEEDDFHLNHIIRLSENQLFIAAEAGMIYRSDDLGKTWQSLEAPYHGSFFGALPASNNILLLFGLRGHLFASQDQGDSWQDINSGTTAMLTTGLKTKQGLCIIAGLNGVLLIDDNCDGKRYKKHQLAQRNGISAMLETSNNDIILIGTAGITTFTP